MCLRTVDQPWLTKDTADYSSGENRSVLKPVQFRYVETSSDSSVNWTMSTAVEPTRTFGIRYHLVPCIQHENSQCPFLLPELG